MASWSKKKDDLIREVRYAADLETDLIERGEIAKVLQDLGIGICDRTIRNYIQALEREGVLTEIKVNQYKRVWKVKQGNGEVLPSASEGVKA